jgi:hypothetical protein
LPRIIVTILALALLAPAYALGGAAPASANTPSCTGWRSMIDPPQTIRVGRADGTVETVEFRTYVARVMVKEWNMTQPAVLETAAVAVKQYAWYHSLAGNWRKTYVNEAGECFDVKDSTADQIYRSNVTVAARIWNAVDATWGLSVRKSNRFFMTGYRTGLLVPCGADANGFRLYAKSVIACGKDGLTREEIQMIYYAPDLTFHWSPTWGAEQSPPAVDTPFDGPTVTLLDGAALGAPHARVAWDSEARRPEGTTYEFQRVVAGIWTTIALPDQTQTSVQLVLKPAVTHGFRVRLRDEAGNYGSWLSTSRFKPRLIQDKNTTGALSWTGAWSPVSTASAAGGSVRRSTQEGSTVTVSFTGRAAALLLTRGPREGTARVYVDDVLEAEVDLYADALQWRTFVFTRHWDKAGAHTVRVEVVPVGGRSQVQFDALLVHP